MELAVIDPFVRSEPAKSGSRNGDTSSVSFSDMLDASSREREARTPAANDSTPARSEPAKPKSNEAKAKPETTNQPAAQPKPKSETSSPTRDAAADPEAPADTSATDAADGSAAPANDSTNVVEAVADAATPGAGAAALELIADLLAANSNIVDLATPKGQMVAAVVVPQNVPENAAAASQHTMAGVTPGVPAPTAPTAPETAPAAGTTPANFDALAQAAAQAGKSAPAPAANADAAATAAAAAANAAPAPANPAAAPVTTPAPSPVATAPAPASVSDPAAHAAMAAAGEGLVAELVDDLDAPVTAPATPDSAPSTGTANASPNRSAASQPTMSGYAAQVVSQEAAAEDAALAPVAPVTADGTSSGLASMDGDDAVLDATADGETLAVAKPADGLSFTTADSAQSREVNSVEAVTARHARHVPVPVAEQVVVRIAKAVADGVDRINVKLSPAELGQIDVRMEIGPDGRFHAVFSADRPQTVELLQRDARDLARALQDAGLRADTGSLSFNLRGQGQQGNSDGAPGHGGSLPRGLVGADLPAEAAPPPVYRSSGPASGRVDIRV